MNNRKEMVFIRQDIALVIVGVMTLVGCGIPSKRDSEAKYAINIDQLVRQVNIHPTCDNFSDEQLFLMIDSLLVIDHPMDGVCLLDLTDYHPLQSYLPSDYVPRGAVSGFLVLQTIDFLETRRNRYCDDWCAIRRKRNNDTITIQDYRNLAWIQVWEMREWINNTRGLSTHDRLTQWNTNYKSKMNIMPSTCLE